MLTSFRWFIPVFISCCLWSFATAESTKAATPALTDAECEKFGRELAGHVNDGEPWKIVDAFDLKPFESLVFRGIDTGKINRAECLQHFTASFKRSMNGWKSGRFVRVFQDGAEKRVLIRLIHEDGSVNFLECVCIRSNRSGVKMADMFSYFTAELISETLRKGLMPLFAENERGFWDKLTKGESAYVRCIPQLAEATKLHQAGNAGKALKILEALPEEVKLSRPGLLARLQAAQAADDKACVRVIEEWEKTFPNDPALAFVSLDSRIIRKDYEGALQCLESLRKRVGTDGYLQALKANVFFMADQPAKAQATIKEAVAAEPDLANSYDIWFGIELQAKNWSGLAEALAAFEKNFPTSDIWVGIQSEESWAPFRETAECKAWLEKRAEKKTATEAK